MTLKLFIALVVTALLGAPVGYAFYQSRLSPDNWVYQGGSPTRWKDGGVHGAPGRSLARGFRSLLSVLAPSGLSAAIVASPVDGVAFGFFRLSRGRLNEPSA